LCYLNIVKIVEVLTEYGTLSLNRAFSYLYDGEKRIGERFRVRVSFGPKKVIGFVLKISDTDKTPEELEKERGFAFKKLNEEDIVDEEPLLSEELLRLAKQVADYYFAPLIVVLQTMLPLSLSPRSSAMRGPKIAYESWVRVLDKNEEGLTSDKQIELLRLISNKGPILKKEAGSVAVLSKLIEKKKVEIYKEEKRRLNLKAEEREEAHPLTHFQEKAYEYLLDSEKAVNLLEGVTGSGKTEVYLHLAERYLEKDKNVIFLVPEINLTPALMDYCLRRFGEKVAILHSGLTNGERYDEYRRIASGAAKVVVGARSAVFAPLSNIGLIILDEEHVESYKQDNAPYYHAREVAIMRAKAEGAKLVLGSATPSLETRARALKGVYGYVTMMERVNAKPLPKTAIIDLTDRHNIGKSSEKISLPLLSKIKEKLDRKEQVLLLLNRRGYWTGIQCPRCGHLFVCLSCGGNLTYHKEDNMLKCHHCGYVSVYPEACPKCGNTHLRRVGYGTERVVKEISDLFPDARIARMDSDVGKVSREVEKTIRAFKDGQYDIIVGTQMLAKGHDFPLLTLSAVVLADIGLSLPTYRAAERTFELIAQAVGRSGRSDKTGEAMIQTYNPNHYAIVYGAKQDYGAFYVKEMQERKIAQYPPYVYLFLLVFSSENEAKAAQVSLNFKNEIAAMPLEGVSLLGPIVPFYAMEGGRYRRSLLIKYKKREAIEPYLRQMLSKYASFGGVHISINVDPLDY